MSLSKAGKIWFLQRQGIGNRLYSYDGTLDLVSSILAVPNTNNDNFQVLRAMQGPEIYERKNWTLGPTYFCGLTCLDDESVMVVTEDYGLMRYDNKKWERISTYWPANGFLNVCGLAITPDKKAVIPVSNSGLIIYDLGRKNYRFFIDKYGSQRPIVQ